MPPQAAASNKSGMNTYLTEYNQCVDDPVKVEIRKMSLTAKCYAL